MKARHPWLRRVGWLSLVVAVLAGGVVARYALQRREHLRLKAAEAARAPVVSPRRPREAAVPAKEAAGPSGAACVRGRVMDHGRPVAGMQVSASAGPPALSGACPCAGALLACGCREGLELVAAEPRAGLVEAVRSETTDAEGAFALCGVEVGVVVWGEHLDGRLALPLDRGAPVRPGAFVALEVRPRLSMQGVVLSAEGPVPGATVHAFTEPPLSVQSVRADERGRFSAQLPEQVGSFVVSAPGFAPQRLEQGFDPNRVAVLRLQRESGLTVRALVDGRPTAGAEVSVEGEAARRTDAQGLAVFSLPAGRHRVRALLGERVGGLTVELSGGGGQRVDLALEPGARVRGVVRDEDGQARAGARVTGLPGPPSLMTDGVGRFVSEPLPRGREVTPAAALEGCAPSRSPALEVGSEDVEVELTLSCRETVTGSVVDAEGRPVAGARVFLGGAERGEGLTTDHTGAFRFHLPPGAAQLEVRHDDYRAHEQPLVVPARDVVVVLDAGGSLSGRVVDGQGAALAGADVTAVPALLDELMGAASAGNTHASTDAEGRFHLAGLSAGRLAVSASADSRGVVVSDVVVLQPGEHREGLTLVLDERVDLQGAVVDERGRPLPGAHVRWDPADEKATLVALLKDAVRGRVDEVLKYMPAASFTDAEGRYEVRGLPLSTVKLTVSAIGYGEVERTASRGDTVDVVLTRRGGRLAGRVVDEAGRPVERFEVDGAARTPEDGRFELEVRDDEHVLSVRAPGFAPLNRSVTLAPGERKELGDLPLARAVALTVEVVEAEGRPVPRAEVRARQAGGLGDSCRADASGRCRLEALAAGRVELSVREEGFVPHDEVLEGTTREAAHTVRLAVAGGRLAGEVFALPGRPGVARRVYVSGPVHRSTSTDAEGRFTIGGVPEGRYCVSFDAPGGAGAEWAVTAEASASPAPVQLGPLAGGATLTGRRALPGRLLLARGAAAPLPASEVAGASASSACDRLRAAVITVVTAGELRVEGIPPGTWSAYFVALSEAADKDAVTPVVVGLLPGETKALP